MLPKPFLLALAFRSLTLLFPQTNFQPDEFYQVLEPAHRHVFGYGYLTWEWRDLPDGGRLRGWLWPSVFIVVYRFLQITGLDDTRLLVLMPRMVGVVVAAVTDWATYRLSSKLMGSGSVAGALLLQLTNIFNAHALTRSFSNSPETMLTTLALVYFPLRAPSRPKVVVNNDSPVDGTMLAGDLSPTTKAEYGRVDVDNVRELNYVAMDRAGPNIDDEEPVRESLTTAVFFASIAICMRPTTISLWAFLGVEYLIRSRVTQSPGKILRDLTTAGITGLAVLGCSTLLDYSMTGKLYFPLWTFTRVNMTISAFFGATSPLYHLTQSLPVILFPVWYWWGQGFIACLLPERYVPKALRSLDRPEGMRSLARAITFAIFTLSVSPHSEWRFLLPFLPSLLLFALPPLFKSYVPTIMGAYRFRESARQYTRIPKWAFYCLLLAPIGPWVFYNTINDWAQVEAINTLRRGEVGQVTGVGIFMYCYSTPLQSHLHRDVPILMLGCEPPLDPNVDRATYKQESELFYEAPLAVFLEKMGRYADEHGPTGPPRPSHIVSFGGTLDMGQTMSSTTGPTIKRALRDMGYKKVWHGWLPNEILRPSEHNGKGVQIWTNDPTVPAI